MAISVLKRIFNCRLLLLCFNCAGAKEITDLTGNRRVTIPDTVERIAVVPIPWMSMIYVVDGSDAKLPGCIRQQKRLYRNSILKHWRPELRRGEQHFCEQRFHD